MVDFRSDLSSLEPYKIKKIAKHNLGDNENRLIDWSDLLPNLTQNLTPNDLSFYGDNRYSEILHAYANYLGVRPSQLVQGVGSDQLIHTIITGFLQADEVLLTVSPDFFMYHIFSQVHGVSVKEYKLEWREGVPFLDVGKFLDFAKATHAKAIILSNPNNPLSIAFDKTIIQEIVSGFTGLVVIDEAYIEFSSVDSMIDLVDQYDNLIVLRTMSKSFGLAGLRLGFSISCELLATEIDKVLAPYSMPNIVGKIGTLALQEIERVETSVKEIITLREDFIAFLRNLPEVEVLQSQTNFVTYTAPYAEIIFQKAQEKDLAFKYYQEGPLTNFIRMGVGTEEEMKLMKEIITEIVKQSKV
ncbi:aminotransferase class I/II-fold pyridoxal phosphate-dependent enzyme [Streptococcus cameli]